MEKIAPTTDQAAENKTPSPNTPPLPQDAKPVNLADNARQVLLKRYVRRGDDGKPAETIEEMFWRVAHHIAKIEATSDGATPSGVQQRAMEFYDLLTTKRFFPNSPTFTGAGTPLGQLAACFTQDMRVTTDKGTVPISRLQIGDRVLTHEGRYRPITELHQRAYQGELLRIKIKLIDTTIEVTPEHPFLTPSGWVKAKDLTEKGLVAVGMPIGVQNAPHFDMALLPYAEELEVQLEDDTVRVRRPSVYQNSGRQAQWVNRFFNLTPDLARLCGYYMAEGTIGPDERYIRFTFGADETQYQEDVIQLIAQIFNAPVSTSFSNYGKWMAINVYNRALVSWFRESFGRGSASKFIPTWMQFAAPEIQNQFLVGLLRGDGMYYQKEHSVTGRKIKKLFRSFRITLANPALIQQVWQMCLRLGYDASIRSVDTTYVTENANPTAQVSMPPLQSRELIKLAFGIDLPAPDQRYIRNTVHHQEGGTYFEIEDIESVEFDGTVYNCEVEEDHTYITEGVVVHNCFVLPISDDMGRASSGIFTTLRNAALIQQTGGGNGFNFSRLRPKGSLVKSSAGQATGPVGFLRVYDHAFGEVAQGGCLLPETLVFTSKGLLRLDEIADPATPGWQPHALDVATDEGPRHSPRAFNNGRAPILRVHTRQGLSLAGTYEHRVKVMGAQGPEWRTLKDLHKGDWILVKLGQHQGRLQALRQPQRQHFNQTMPTLPALLDAELAFFLGYLSGDGFVASQETDHRIGVSVAHTSYLMDGMPRLLERLFGVTVHKQQKPDDRSVTFVIDNKAVKEFLQMNELSKPASHDASIPRLIRQSPPEIAGAYLRGLFEADGTLSHGYPSLMTTSPRLAEEAATLLIGLGCPVATRTITPGIGHYGTLSVFQVRIVSSAGLQAWREKIGCDQRSRFVAAYAWQSDLSRESTYTLPNARYWIQPVLDAITLEQIDAKGRGMGLNFRSSVPLLRRALLRYNRSERQFTRSAFDELSRDYPEFAAHARQPDGSWFVRVTGVEEAGEALTLDLEVDENHTYLAYGMVTHNTRRGANMAVLRVDHPDVEEFITCKTNENQITNFNISVGITDAFMRAVAADADWDLVFPDVMSPQYKTFTGTLDQAAAAGMPVKVHRTVRARDLFDKIVTQAHHNGEPGLLFLDAANRSNPVPHLYQLEATNPCGEQFLGPYENCCLGSVNLAQHFGPDGTVDWEKLRRSVELSTIFLDDVVDANAYVPAVPELAVAAHRARRIGLGIMGLADLMYHVRVRYGSAESLEFASQVMEFVRYHSMRTSVDLARARGPFEAIQGSIYDPKAMTWQPPTPMVAYTKDWKRPAVDWDGIVKDIHQYGIRNAAQTTIAPTGTIATVASCEGYGCEPVFALAYVRHVNDNGKDLQLAYASPLFEEALLQAGLDVSSRQAIVDRTMQEGTCQGIPELPKALQDVFVVSADINAEEHVRMQAALQAFVDNSLSKTINFPAGAAQADVAHAYQLAWELGCKGITVYVTGSRDKVVLETKATLDKKQGQPEGSNHNGHKPVEEIPVELTVNKVDQPALWHETKKPRPRFLHGYTCSIETPLGKAFITININGGEQPFEVFINTAKAGSDTAAVSEAIGRLVSYILRLASPVEPRQRLAEVVRQLNGIGGGRSMGFGPNRVRSLPDGVARALDEYLQNSFTGGEHAAPTTPEAQASVSDTAVHADASSAEATSVAQQPYLQIGDLCPECGQAAMVNEEGCHKCYACGFSEC